MIKLRNLNKKYNKGKRNEIHVINNISLDLPKTGLVCLLGPSGSGKSTLLNAIGGLDKVDNGVIDFNGEVLKKYSFRQWDKLRSKNIGYIFQNYILLPEMTVYDNIKFSLQLTNIALEEIDSRIEYALQAVKMEKFKKRKAKNLSGGQQQRVAIARALVTSPNVIIADEPTGNLDAANSTQIMNIIKKISKECLVILVTHNTNLAYFYADRIIELKDGRIIKDYDNISSGNLSFKQDQNIYLQDYQKSTLTEDNINLEFFYSEEKPKVEIKVIFKDNTFFITADGESSKIKFLTPGDEIKVIDGKKTGLSQEDVDDFNYHLEKINETRTRRISVVSIKESFKMAFNRLKGLRKFQKLLLSGFILSAIMIVISVSTLLGTYIIRSDKFIDVDRNLISISTDDSKTSEDLIEEVNEIYKLKTNDSINPFTSKYGSNSLYLVYDIFMQVPTRERLLRMNNTIVDLKALNEKDIIIGRYPTSNNEIVIDKAIVDKFLKNQHSTSIGYRKYEDLVGEEFKYNEKLGKIVGISNTKNPTVYMNNEFKLTSSYENFLVFDNKDLYTTSYTEVLKDDEILVREGMMNDSLYIRGMRMKVVGTFNSPSEQSYVTNRAVLEKLEIIDLLNGKQLAIYSTNPKETLKVIPAKFKAKLLYDELLKDYRRNNAMILSSQMVFAVVILSATLLFLYFMIRSSMIQRIYEIGVYRALGVPKRDIYKVFGVEITLITLFTSFVGWGIISYIFLKSLKSLVYESLYYSWPLAFVVLLGIWLINLLVGLLPVNTLLRKTPAEIITKYDI